MVPDMTQTPSLARLLLDRFRWFDQALLAALNEGLGLELTSAQSLLFADLPFDGARQADLARRLGVSRQAVNELVRGLERQRLVEIVADPEDGRSKLVRPTSRGKESIAMALETFAGLEQELRARIGALRFDQLRRALDAEWGNPPGRP